MQKQKNKKYTYNYNTIRIDGETYKKINNYKHYIFEVHNEHLNFMECVARLVNIALEEER